MTDASAAWNGDLSLSPSGDLALVSGDAETQQRLIRRLSTNSGDYIWQTTYGAGLPGYVGSTVTADEIQAIVQQQAAFEPTVASVPAPVTTVVSDATGNLTATVLYATNNGTTGSATVSG